MEFNNVIQASAKVIQITELGKGDIFKIIETSDYSTPEVKYGIVIDILNDGQKGFVQTVVFGIDYNGFKKELKLLTSKKMENTAIFPATIEELKQTLGDKISDMQRNILKKEKELEEYREGLNLAEDIVGGTLQMKLKTPKFIEEKTGKFLTSNQ